MLHYSKSLGITHEPWWLPSDIISTTNHDLRDWSHMIRQNHKHNGIQKTSFLPWGIWKKRNNVIFRNELFNPLACIICAKKGYAKWKLQSCMLVEDYLKGPSSTPSTSNHFIKWYPPLPRYIKIKLTDHSNIHQQ